MTSSFTNDVAIVIPARNEEDRIGACLRALAGQCTARTTVILVVNNTTDCTSEAARDVAVRFGLNLTVLERRLRPHEGVGTARKIGCDHALKTMTALQYLLTTDADCIVAPDWIIRNLAHLEMVDAVCGKIDLIEDEAGILDDMDPHFATLEGNYRKLVQDFYARHATGCSDIGDTHGEAAGASLAFLKSAYLDVGGFAQVPCGEDRQIVRALRSFGRNVRHASDVRVHASCRLSGRAVGGMSDALKARINGLDYRVDDCLPPANWLIMHANCKTLGPWPPQVPTRFRLNVRDLPQHIKVLENFCNSGQLAPVSIAPVDDVPCFYNGSSLPDRESAIVPTNPHLQTCLPLKDGMSAPSETKASVLSTAKGT